MRRNVKWRKLGDEMKQFASDNEITRPAPTPNTTAKKFSALSVNALSFLARRTLPQGEHAICPGCLGVGSPDGRQAMQDCATVKDGFQHCDPSNLGPCSIHRCHICRGKGVVCPFCGGMRFVRRPTRGGNELMRCDKCCEGNNVNEPLEMRAIQHYILHGFPKPDATTDETGQEQHA